ncbi:MAG: MBL fold metallo-hydrolase [Bacteriovoracia bacterium]
MIRWLVPLLILFFCEVVLSEPKYPLSDHYDGDKFHNPGKTDQLKSFWDVLKWQLTSDKVPFPEHVPNKNYPFRPLTSTNKVNVTFINHATFLIQLPGLNVLTDPVYSQRVSPFTFFGPKRVREPGLPFEDLPPIDVVIVSHSHYDHLDTETLKQLDKKYHPLILLPLGNESMMRRLNIQNFKTMDWWESESIKDVKITFAPAQHWSNRHLWDKNETLWGSFMVDNGQQKIYFAGDTGLGPHFKEIRKRHGSPDLALLPIGAYKPRWFMQFHHMNPEDSVRAHQELEAKRSIGMHFGTWQLTDEGINEPVEDLKVALEKAGLKEDDFLVLDQGQSLSY